MTDAQSRGIIASPRAPKLLLEILTQGPPGHAVVRGATRSPHPGAFSFPSAAWPLAAPAALYPLSGEEALRALTALNRRVVGHPPSGPPPKFWTTARHYACDSSAGAGGEPVATILGFTGDDSASVFSALAMSAGDISVALAAIFMCLCMYLCRVGNCWRSVTINPLSLDKQGRDIMLC